MKNICKNCGTKFTGNYCNTCGQKADTGKLTFRSVIDNWAYGLTNCDTGILFTYKELFTRPGRMLADYISGKRVIYFKPFPMLFITAGLYGLLTQILVPEAATPTVLNPEIVSPGTQTVKPADPSFWSRIFHYFYEWANTSMAFSVIITLPLYAWAARCTFRIKKGYLYNYTEYLFIFAYMACQRLVVGIFLEIPLLIYTGKNEIEGNWSTLLYLVYFSLTAWDLGQLFKFSVKKTIKKTIQLYLYWFLGILLLLVALVILCILLVALLKALGWGPAQDAWLEMFEN